MRVVVTGGRYYSKKWNVFAVLDMLRPEALAHGMATGADSLAQEWADCNGLIADKYPADWNKYGNGAGPIRNQKMLDEFKPDLVVAFPGDRGTSDCKTKARAMAIYVLEIE